MIEYLCSDPMHVALEAVKIAYTYSDVVDDAGAAQARFGTQIAPAQLDQIWAGIRDFMRLHCTFVHGRKLCLKLKVTDNSILFPSELPDKNLQTWLHAFPTYRHLLKRADEMVSFKNKMRGA
jgi:hypothetical protein